MNLRFVGVIVLAMGGGTFNYQPGTMTNYGPCGMEGMTTCLMPQTFAIVP